MTMLSNDNKFMTIIEPPNYLDGAKVIKWSWSGLYPFGFVYSTDNTSREEIYGFAICQYENSGSIYRFSCNKNWEVIQDSDYESFSDAVNQLPEQYKNVEPNWQLK